MEHIVYILSGIVVFQSVVFFFERRDLYSRIQAQNLTEYVESKKTRVEPVKDERLRL